MLFAVLTCLAIAALCNAYLLARRPLDRASRYFAFMSHIGCCETTTRAFWELVASIALGAAAAQKPVQITVFTDAAAAHPLELVRAARHSAGVGFDQLQCIDNGSDRLQINAHCELQFVRLLSFGLMYRNYRNLSMLLRQLAAMLTGIEAVWKSNCPRTAAVFDFSAGPCALFSFSMLNALSSLQLHCCLSSELVSLKSLWSRRTNEARALKNVYSCLLLTLMRRCGAGLQNPILASTRDAELLATRLWPTKTVVLLEAAELCPQTLPTDWRSRKNRVVVWGSRDGLQNSSEVQKILRACERNGYEVSLLLLDDAAADCALLRGAVLRCRGFERSGGAAATRVIKRRAEQAVPQREALHFA